MMSSWLVPGSVGLTKLVSTNFDELPEGNKRPGHLEVEESSIEVRGRKGGEGQSFEPARRTGWAELRGIGPVDKQRYVPREGRVTLGLDRIQSLGKS